MYNWEVDSDEESCARRRPQPHAGGVVSGDGPHPGPEEPSVSGGWQRAKRSCRGWARRRGRPRDEVVPRYRGWTVSLCFHLDNAMIWTNIGVRTTPLQ
ncbi:unnamed protein product [Caretta caretta]